MKKTIVITICTLSLIGFSSCGSTSPCGLAKNEPTTKQYQKQYQLEKAEITSAIMVADASIITE
ncbi:lipoprotein [Tenacibaculum piscium]|uniref:hypothetical protein n=1 Tax=Tenacibaculum piscium TaxID=1458515 RepID=UPI001F2C6806|nr:hypothetical protein [Tenacibaculum piscium]